MKVKTKTRNKCESFISENTKMLIINKVLVPVRFLSGGCQGFVACLIFN